VEQDGGLPEGVAVPLDGIGGCYVFCGGAREWMARAHVHRGRAYVVPLQHPQANLEIFRLP
jgi:hypothetical protein